VWTNSISLNPLSPNPQYGNMLALIAWAVLGPLLLCQGVEARSITIVNQCGTKIFPAYAGRTGRLMNGGTAAPAGWEIPAGGKTVLDLPETCESTRGIWPDARGFDGARRLLSLTAGLNGRIWIRSGGKGCDTDVTKCLIGQCQSSGGLEWCMLSFETGEADASDGTELGGLGRTVGHPTDPSAFELTLACRVRDSTGPR